MATHTVRSFCRFCAAMCGVVVTVEDDRALAVRGDPSHPLSTGYLSAKGRALAAFTTAPERLRDPQVGRPDERVERSWDVVLDDLAERIGRVVDESGSDAVGAYLGVASAFDSAGRSAGCSRASASLRWRVTGRWCGRGSPPSSRSRPTAPA